MIRIRTLLLALGSLLVVANAWADSTVVSLPAATTLVGSSTYLNQAGSSNNQLLFNPTLFSLLGGGVLTISPNSIGTSLLTPTIASGSCTSCNLSYGADGRLLTASNGSGGGGSPGGVTNALQYNAGGGTFGGLGLGSTTTVLHGNPAGLMTFAPVNLGTDITGNLPTTNLNFGTGASSATFWRGDGSWAVPSGGGAPGGSSSQVQYNNSGAFGGSSGLTLNSTKITSASIGLGSDATGDLYYNGGGGLLTRLGIGSTGQVLTVAGGLPSWASSGSGTAFSAITSSTNTTAVMNVGSGASMIPSGSGVITATNVPAALGTGTVCSTAGVLSVPAGCPVVPTVNSNASFSLTSANGAQLVLATNGSPTTVSIAQSTGGLGTGFGVDLFTEGASSTLTPTTSKINNASSVKLGAYQDIALSADSLGNYVGALSVPMPPTQTGTTCLIDNMTWSSSCGSGGGNMTGSGASTTGDILLANNTGGTLTTAIDSGVAPSTVDDPQATGTITTAQWANNDILVPTSASQIITLPASSTLTRNGGLVIVPSISGSTTLLVTSPDVIATVSGTTAAGGSITIPGGSIAVVTAKISGTVKVNDSAVFANTQAVTNQLTISTSTFTPVFVQGINQKMLLIHGSCPCTIANPANPQNAIGQTGMLDITQSSTGSDTIGTWGSMYITPGGTASLTLSTGANDIDHIPYRIIDSTHILLGAVMANATH